MLNFRTTPCNHHIVFSTFSYCHVSFYFYFGLLPEENWNKSNHVGFLRAVTIWLYEQYNTLLLYLSSTKKKNVLTHLYSRITSWVCTFQHYMRPPCCVSIKTAGDFGAPSSPPHHIAPVLHNGMLTLLTTNFHYIYILLKDPLWLL